MEMSVDLVALHLAALQLDVSEYLHVLLRTT